MSNLPKALKTSAKERAEQRLRDYKFDGRRRRRIRLHWIMIRRGNRRVLRPAATTLQWARMFELPTRFLAKTRVGQHEVSTIFMGLDHGVMAVTDLVRSLITNRYFTEQDFAEALHEARRLQFDEGSHD